MERRTNQGTGGERGALIPAAEVIPPSAEIQQGAVKDIAILQREDKADTLQMLSDAFRNGINMQRDVERIKGPTSGGHTFKLTTLDGDKHVETIEGVIVAHRVARMFWDRPFGVGGKQPPSCSSTDGIMGIGNPGGPCARCAFAAPGSKLGPDGKPSKASACREVKQLLIMRGESILPDLINISPGSLSQVIPYLRRLLGANKQFFHVITEISLAPEKNSDGIEYSQFRFRRLPGEMTPEQKQTMTELFKIFNSALHTITLNEKDYQAVHGGGSSEE